MARGYHIKNQAKPKGKDLATNKIVDFIAETNEMEAARTRSIDDLALHDELMLGVLGSVKNDLAAGLSPDKIYAKYGALAAARMVSIAATEADSGKAMMAIKDILDRQYGKATERKEIRHKLENVDPKQLDAILISELEGLSVDEADGED